MPGVVLPSGGTSKSRNTSNSNTARINMWVHRLIMNALYRDASGESGKASCGHMRAAIRCSRRVDPWCGSGGRLEVAAEVEGCGLSGGSGRIGPAWMRSS